MGRQTDTDYYGKKKIFPIVSNSFFEILIFKLNIYVFLIAIKGETLFWQDILLKSVYNSSRKYVKPAFLYTMCKIQSKSKKDILYWLVIT